ncbi:MAG: hypothetical protein K2X29_10080 [Candidatus Obscuribacterales bacterium]|nr:hypothetical protein [Candidatus Obscuribacterales bacterium]
MNSIQKFVLLAGIIFAVATLMYVPWNHVDDDGDKQSVGYGLINEPPVAQEQHGIDIFGLKIGVSETIQGNQVDTSRVLPTLAVVVLVTGGLLVLFGRTKSMQV